MPIRPFQNSFNSGELSPRLRSRSDIDRYTSGVAEMTNWIPLVQGGVKPAYGTRFVHAVKDSAKTTRLFPFEFSDTQPYVIEVGDQYMRFYRDGAIISEAAVNITNCANNGSGAIRVTATAHGLSTNDYTTISGVKGTTEANGEWQVTVIDANNFDLNNSTFTNTYDSGGTTAKIVQLTTPYLEADLPGLKFAQSADILYIVSRKYKPRKLERTSHTTWTLTVVDFIDGPYLDENATATTLTPSATTGAGITITASATAGINGGSGFLTTDVGRLVRIKHTSTWGYAKIVGHTSSTVVTADVINDFGSATASSVWRLGAWSDTTGYPGAITIFEQRLWFGATDTEPQDVWGSTSGSYEDMSPSATDGTIADSDAINYTLGSNKVNVIQWLLGADRLHIGTLGEEFVLDGGNDPVTPSSVRVRGGSAEGSNIVQAIRSAGGTIYAKRAGGKVLELKFDFNKDRFDSDEVSVFAEHLFRETQIKSLFYQQDPDRIIWTILGNGKAKMFVYHPTQGVTAWASRDTDGNFEDVVSIPAIDGTRDDAYFIIQRTINGVKKRYIEVTDPSFHVDSGLSSSEKQGSAELRVPAASTEAFVPGGGAFPTGPYLWVEANDLDATLNDNDDVTTWVDKGSGGNDLTGGADAGDTKPIFKESTIIGHDTVRFQRAGSDTIGAPEVVAEKVLGSAHTMFHVVKVPAVQPTADQTMFACQYILASAAADAYELAINARGERRLRYRDTTDTIKEVTFGPSVVPDNVEIWWSRKTNNTIEVGVNALAPTAVSDAKVIPPAETPGTPRWGKSPIEVAGDQKEYFDGHLGEVILYTSSLSDTDKDNMLAFLAAKYAITGTPIVFEAVISQSSATAIPTNGLQMHLDADAETGGHGSALGTWTDQSGNSNDASQATGTKQPLLQHDQIFGRKAVLFDGTDDTMTLTTAIGNILKSDEQTVFIVARADAAVVNHARIMIARTDTPTKEHEWRRSNSAWTCQYIKAGEAEQSISTGTFAVDTNLILMSRRTGGAIKTQLNQDTAATASDVVDDPDTLNSAFIGSFVDSSNYWKGLIAEVIVYNRALTDSEVIDVQEVLADKYGIGLQTIFTNDDIGREILILPFTDATGTSFPKSRAKITQVVDSTHVVVEIIEPFPTTGATYEPGFWYKALTIATGLGHLEGKVVDIVGDDAVYPQQTVSGGSVNLQQLKGAGVVVVGLPRICTLKLLEPHVPTSRGTMRGRIKRWVRSFLDLEDARGLTVNGRPMNYRTPADLMGVVPPAFTGDKDVHVASTDLRRAPVTIVQDIPAFAAINGFYGELDVED